MSKSDCRRTADRLTPYLDEALPPEEQAEVEQHLKRCPPCEEAAARERIGRKVLRALADRLGCEALPPSLRARCEALVREHGSRKVE